MIDVENESLVTIREATRFPEFRRNGRPVHISTVWRWIASGKLESVIVGGLRMTSRESCRRMIARDNGVKPLPSPRQREKEIDALERKLSACGI